MALPAGEDTCVPARASVGKLHPSPKSRNLTPSLCDHPCLLSSNKLTEAAGRSGAEEEREVVCAWWSRRSGAISTAVTARQSGSLPPYRERLVRLGQKVDIGAAGEGGRGWCQAGL